MTSPHDLKVDDEFKRLSPQMPNEYLQQLETSIHSDGCKEPIDIWNNTILDGHKRHNICLHCNYPLMIRLHSFSCKEEAIIWICQRHLTVSSISLETGVYLIGKYFNAQKMIYKRESPGNEFFHQRLPSYVYRAALEIGKLYGFSASTIYKYGQYAANLDCIFDKNSQIANYVLNAKLKISHKNMAHLAALPDEALSYLSVLVETGKVDHVVEADLQRLVLKLTVLNKKRSLQGNTNTQQHSIKKAPVFDPDAEVASLYLTIPTWIGSIKRCISRTKFPLVTNDAKSQLQQQLEDLDITVMALLDHLSEESK